MEHSRTARLRAQRRTSRYQILIILTLVAGLIFGLLVVDHSYQQMTREEGKLLAAVSRTFSAALAFMGEGGAASLQVPPDLLPPKALLLGRSV